MTKPTLYVMIGVPGSGKSYFAKLFPCFKDKIRVSRDEIRFSMLRQGDHYFKYEKLVFQLFISNINNFLKQGHDVIADATHISKASRAKLLSNIDKIEDINVVAIVMDTPLEECLINNSQREGLAKIKNSIIADIFLKREFPSLDEGFNDIWSIKAKSLW